MVKKIATILIVSLLLPLLAGCWNRKEVSELAIIMGVAVDKVNYKEKEGKMDHKIMLTMMFARPKAAAGGERGQPGEKPYTIISTLGKDVYEASRNLALEVPREIYWGHNIILIIGDEMARHGVNDIMDFLARSPQPRETMWVMVTKGAAHSILEARTEMELIPAQHIGFLARTRAGIAVNLKDFLINLSDPDTNPIASEIEIVSKGKLINLPESGQPLPESKDKAFLPRARLTGTAVFKYDKLVGFLNQSETRGLLWLWGEIKKGLITVACPGEKDKRVSVNIVRGSTILEPKIEKGRLYIEAKMLMEGDLQEQQCVKDLTDRKNIALLEKALRKDIEARAKDTLRKVQQRYKSDIFGFGLAIHRKYPAIWKELGPNWERDFPKLQIKFKVEAKIRRSGIMTKPAMLREKQE
ncbi:MAG: Ger(x)C family spore germination protein [Clostridia bacterium]|nr:Ger(x)C family spore germination protein [Clostridia bacterium]